MSKFHVSVVTDTQNGKQHTVIMTAADSSITLTIGKRTEAGVLESAQEIRLNKVGAKRLKSALSAIIQSI